MAAAAPFFRGGLAWASVRLSVFSPILSALSERAGWKRAGEVENLRSPAPDVMQGVRKNGQADRVFYRPDRKNGQGDRNGRMADVSGGVSLFGKKSYLCPH